MSPEQALGKTDVDERVDVWALAVVLYETLTGSRPFDGPNYNALIAAITKDAPLPILDYGAGDEALWAIIARGLEKDADARWPSMAAFGSALAEWAIAKGCTTDVTGTSLETEWLGEGARRGAVASRHGTRKARRGDDDRPPRARGVGADDGASALERHLFVALARSLDRGARRRGRSRRRRLVRPRSCLERRPRAGRIVPARTRGGGSTGAFADAVREERADLRFRRVVVDERRGRHRTPLGFGRLRAAPATGARQATRTDSRSRS